MSKRITIQPIQRKEDSWGNVPAPKWDCFVTGLAYRGTVYKMPEGGYSAIHGPLDHPYVYESPRFTDCIRFALWAISDEVTGSTIQ